MEVRGGKEDLDKRQNYGGLDRFRIIAAFMVAAIHTSPLLSYSADADFLLTRVLCRVAVPFFFMVTGQFVVRDFFTCEGKALEKFCKYFKNMAVLYGAAILIYLPVGIYAGHYKELNAGLVFRMLLFDGTFYHLWYFPACMMGVALTYLMSRLIKGKRLKTCAENSAEMEKNIGFALTVSGFLYVIGLLGDSYFGFLKEGTLVYNVYMQGFRIFSYTRNGLFMAPVFLLLGAEIGNRKSNFDPLKRQINCAGLIVSLLLMAVEAFTLRNFGMQRHDSMYIMLIPTSIFLVKTLLTLEGPSSKILRNISLWIYVLHPAMIIVVRATAKILHLTGILVNNSLAHYFAVVFLSVLAAAGISKLMESSKKENFKCGRAWIEISKSALRQNVTALRKRIPDECRLMPALKANAYGHGALLIARELADMGVDAFCVASLEEGIQLRRQGIKGEILILGYTHPELFPLLRRYHLTQTVVDFPYAVLLNRYGRKIHVHIGVDTGMHRLGERCENVDRIYSICQMKNLIVDGIFTHLCADDKLEKPEMDYTDLQVNAFYKVVETLEKKGCGRPEIHLQSSYGVFNYPELGEDYARTGIALYGVLSTKEDTEKCKDILKPVLSLKARAASVRNIYAGENVGYGLKFKAERDMKIAALAIGYADGLPRGLSGGRGTALIEGHRVSVVGRICMDQTIVDVSDIPGVKAGDVAVLIGKSGDEEISACDLAKETGTITNEILSRLGTRLERIVV